MNARRCPPVVAARTVPAWRAIGVAAVVVAVIASLAGCGSATTSPSASGPVGSGAAPVPTPVPTATPTAHADTMRFGGVDYYTQGMEMNLFRQASAQGLPYIYPGLVTLGSLVYGTLYRWNARYDAVPDLADGPCKPEADPRILRCRIIATAFHDGTLLTADDVAYTFHLYQRDTLALGQVGGNQTGELVEARIVDPRTVDFVLGSVDPTFLTTVVPGIPILSRHAVEAAYADFIARTKSLSAAELTKLADAIDEEAGRDPPVCAPHLDRAATILEQIGVRLYREDFSRNTGKFDQCGYARDASGFIRQAAVAMGLSGDDAVAAAFGLLSTDWKPIGTGPYRFVSEDVDRVHLEAWPGYDGGPAATRYVDLVPTRTDGSDLVGGTVDIFQLAFLGSAYAATAESRGVRIATNPNPGYLALEFNVRPGHLFAERDLRRALQLCIDLPRDVDAVTGGGGTPVYGPVLPGSWADDPDLPKPPHDAAAARSLIEAAGWTAGADGVYAKDGARLAADIIVRAEDQERTKMADLIALQAGECGMDLRSRPVAWGVLKASVLQYPHSMPGTDTQFDLYLGAWSGGAADPGRLDQFVSSAITDVEHPDVNERNNIIGFESPTLDRLAEAAMSTYDQKARASLYRQAQEQLAAQLPYLFLWGMENYDVVRSAVTTVDGPLDLTLPYWAWQPERLVVEANP